MKDKSFIFRMVKTSYLSKKNIAKYYKNHNYVSAQTMGTVSAQTKPLLPWFNGLLVPKNFNGLVGFGFSIDGSVRFKNSGL